MARRTLNNLTAMEVARLTKPGAYSDGGNLYLQIAPSGAKSWEFRYAQNGRRRAMGLGGFPAVPLARARKKAAECRELHHRGEDPIEKRRATTAQARFEIEREATTFRICAAAYLEAHEPAWRSPKTAPQWRASLRDYVYPVFGDVAVSKIDVELVLRSLQPVWHAKPETARRVRNRIELVLDWAKVKGYRDGENVARWRGHLSYMMPNMTKLRPVMHHPALGYPELPGFMAELAQQKGIGGRALEFLILTVVRASTATGARWDEVDEANRIWVIPAERMKSARAFRVPLSDPALAILERMKGLGSLGSPFVFPGFGRQTISTAALLKVLKRLGRGDATCHGFRSSFRDWAGEVTAFSPDLAELALAHSVGGETERAYRRGDALAKRRELMNAWAQYCCSPATRLRDAS